MQNSGKRNTHDNHTGFPKHPFFQTVLWPLCPSQNDILVLFKPASKLVGCNTALAEATQQTTANRRDEACESWPRLWCITMVTSTSGLWITCNPLPTTVFGKKLNFQGFHFTNRLQFPFRWGNHGTSCIKPFWMHWPHLSHWGQYLEVTAGNRW